MKIDRDVMRIAQALLLALMSLAVVGILVPALISAKSTIAVVVGACLIVLWTAYTAAVVVQALKKNQ